MVLILSAFLLLTTNMQAKVRFYRTLKKITKQPYPKRNFSKAFDYFQNHLASLLVLHHTNLRIRTQNILSWKKGRLQGMMILFSKRFIKAMNDESQRESFEKDMGHKVAHTAQILSTYASKSGVYPEQSEGSDRRQTFLAGVPSFHESIKHKIITNIADYQENDAIFQNNSLVKEIKKKTKTSLAVIRRFLALRDIILLKMLKLFLPYYHADPFTDRLNTNYQHHIKGLKKKLQRAAGIRPYTMNRLKSFFKGVGIPKTFSAYDRHIYAPIARASLLSGRYPKWLVQKRQNIQQRINREAGRLAVLKMQAGMSYQAELERLNRKFSKNKVKEILKKSLGNS